jgi:hypothetical protein
LRVHSRQFLSPFSINRENKNCKFIWCRTSPIHISLVTYSCLHPKKKQQTNKQKRCKNTLHQDLNPRHRDDTLSDFNNYIKFYIIMSASNEFTIFVFSIYWKGTEKLSAIQTQSLITRSYRQWTQVFARFQFTLYISYKTTVFQNIILKSIHVRF